MILRSVLLLIMMGMGCVTASAQDMPAAVTTTTNDDFKGYRLVFPSGSATLPESELALLGPIIQAMKDVPAIDMQLRAYADGTPDTIMQARRLSLLRGMAVRSYVIHQGIPARRIDLRAMGIGSDVLGDQAGKADAPDRVEAILLRR